MTKRHCGTLEKPAIYQADLMGDYMKEWRWVLLSELCHCTKTLPGVLWENFQHASNDTLEHTIYWSYDLAEYQMSPEVEPDWSKDLFVPAGWSNNVLKLYGHGAARAEVVRHICNVPIHECPPGAISCTGGIEKGIGRAIVGFDANGEPVNCRVRAPVHWARMYCCRECVQKGRLIRNHRQYGCSMPPMPKELEALKERRAYIDEDPNQGLVLIYKT
jgi:hypothetical protein